MSYKDMLDEDRRLHVLKLLESQAGYALNESVLQTALDRLGHTVSRDALRADLAWLADLRLLEVDAALKEMLVATLTLRGAEVASGKASVPGVKRPRPQE